MTYHVEIRDAVYADIHRQADYIERDSPQNAELFIRRAYQGLRDLAVFPRAYRKFDLDRPELASVRCGRIPKHRDQFFLFTINEDERRVTIARMLSWSMGDRLDDQVEVALDRL